MKTRTAWQTAWASHLAYGLSIDARVKKIQDRQHEKGWALAASVGIDRNMCCVHNASIDDDMRGWCKDNPHRLAVTKAAIRKLEDWRANNAGRRLVEAHYEATIRSKF